MDNIIGIGRVTANSVVIYKSIFYKIIGRKLMTLSYIDDDAQPFGRFPIFNPDNEIIYKFYIGDFGDTHGTLLQFANIDNQRILGNDWMHNPQFADLVSNFKIQSAGQLWNNRHLIVMRDTLPTPEIVKYALTQLTLQGYDISDYRLLYSDSNNKIHLCTILDYLSGSASKYGYKSSEDLSFFENN